MKSQSPNFRELTLGARKVHRNLKNCTLKPFSCEPHLTHLTDFRAKALTWKQQSHVGSPALAIPDDWPSPTKTALTSKRIDIQGEENRLQNSVWNSPSAEPWITQIHWAQTVRIWFLALWKFVRKKDFRRVTRVCFSFLTKKHTKLLTS